MPRWARAAAPLALALVLGLVRAHSAAAQTSGSVTATLDIGTILSIGITNLDVQFPSPQTADWTAGYVDAGTSSQVSHKGNVRHGVQVRADAATMTGTALSGGGQPRTDKPASDVRLRIDAGSWQGLSSTTPIEVVTNAAPGAYSASATIDYRLLLSDADVAGTYTLGFTFTVVAQ